MLAVYPPHPPLRLISRVHRDREEGPITSAAVAYNHSSSILSSEAAIRMCTLSPHHHLFIYSFFSVSVCHSDFFFLQICRQKKKKAKKTHMALKARSETRKVKDSETCLRPQPGPIVQLLR